MDAGIANHNDQKAEPGIIGKCGVKLVHGGKEYFALLIKLINEATHIIHLQTYIFDDDDTGNMVAAALKKAVKRNVIVYVLADGYASQVMSKKSVQSLIDAGIYFRFFEPVLKSRYFYFGRRMHHKIFVADRNIALVGGINISDRYNDLPTHSAWLDFALLVKGDIAAQLATYCRDMWEINPSDFTTITSVPASVKTGDLTSVCDGLSIIMRVNDWVHGKNQISRTYINMLRHAESNVTILSSYFLPGKAIRKNIAFAIKKGVNIRVITTGISDVHLVKHAERWLYGWLLRKGVEIFEYQKSVLHGKLAVCDDKWMTIGSYNINDISTYASIELNLDVHQPAFSRQTRLELDNIIQKDCIKITAPGYNYTTNIFEQLIRWISYRIFRIVFRVFTFYFKRHNYPPKAHTLFADNIILDDHTQRMY
ncbi:phospholipase D-like domain-containing protein [Danxiaibacter flavus]|uniref:Phospholipase D-like domain-containing protein n=1 Tax=Danxiaibacter flavus TaxID=3049108 RepID=A0ABV3ZMV8_9BACT|nr:phospholipase D-like domain-containing protein [Chitinophagaceae bacterium DXS]